MKSKLLLFSILLIIPTGICGCAGFNTQALKMLSQLSQNDKLKEQTLNQETASFNKVKECIVNNKIEIGISAETAISEFGEPIVVLPESEREKWAYKPSDADWVGGEKIYLFFDREGSLTHWECVNCQ